MTNQEIAIAIGYTLVERIERDHLFDADVRCWDILQPNGKRLCGTAMSASHLMGEDSAWNMINSIRPFRTNDLAAFEIDDWLVNERGFWTRISHDSSGARYEILSGNSIIAGEFGPTRSAAIVAAFEQFMEGEK